MTVNGVKMVFSKEKMLKRLEKIGMMHKVTAKELAIMDNLDGQPVGINSWERQVKGEPVYICQGKDGTYLDVHEDDCIPASQYK